MNENGKFCVTCGNPLTGNQEKYCCKKCSYLKPKIERICANPDCGKKFITANKKKKCCCTKCAKKVAYTTIKDPIKAANRPFTEETAYLIRLWYKQGDSKEQIAEALGRSLENIEQAFV